MKRLTAALLAMLMLITGSALAFSAYYDIHDLRNFGYLPVVTEGRGSLVFQKTPRGSFMSGFQYADGEMIYVNLNYRESGYALAYENGVYGYVDADYIDWNYPIPYAPYNSNAYSYKTNLDLFEYRRVVTNGKGALVFQTEPRGPFLSEHQFNDGDWIFVHPNWREGNYAFAYEDGVFGYVDARYIDWN